MTDEAQQIAQQVTDAMGQYTGSFTAGTHIHEPVTFTTTLTELPWFPFVIKLPDCTIELHADGTWTGSIEALREALAKGKGYVGTGPMGAIMWLILREMERDQRFW